MDILGGHSATAWILFNLLIIVFLVLDLGLVNRKAHTIGFRESLLWSVLWTIIGLAFSGVVIHYYGRQSGLEYVTGYVVERALSIDNIFVFVIIFKYFGVPSRLQYRVLFWGILGALVMRGVFILAGAALVSVFHWALYFFGAFLIYSGIHLLFQKEESPHPERNVVVRLATRLFPVDLGMESERFLVKKAGRWHATPLFIVLLVLATTDFVFALDSLPAIFGVTRDPFIMYTSNVFAILGMRVLYFLLAAMLPQFRFLTHGLSAVLVLIGARMLAEPWIEIPTALTLLIVVGILGTATLASVVFKKRGNGAGV